MAFDAQSYHKPILAEKCIEFLNVRQGGIYVDCTAGGGGHSALILEKLSGKGKLLAFDKDDDAIRFCAKRFEGCGSVELIKSDFKNAARFLAEKGLKPDGILMDLGISSHQIDEKSRGFSYMSRDSALDMRMDRTQSLTAKEILNEYDERKIFEIVRDYGEEKFASKISKNIVAFRTVQPIETTGQLNDIIDASIPLSVRKKGGHPAKRTYQALRIAVNGELDGLGEAIKELALSLRVGGRMVVLSFHSLEDRIVKQTFKELEADCVCDKNAPICVCGKRREIKILTKPVSPDKSEIDDNPRAASAKLRACERV